MKASVLISRKAHRGRCRIVGSVLAVLLWTGAALALEVPALVGRVNDSAGMLSASAVRRIETLLKDLEQKDSTQVVVLTIPSLQGESLEDFSIRVAERWKIGHKGLDNGAILIVAREDRKVRIEVGYGLEGRLTDLTAGRIIRERIVPEFRAGRFDQGVLNGVEAVIEVVRGEFKAPATREPRGIADKGAGIVPFLIVFIFLVFTLGRVSRALGTAAGGFLMPFLGHMAFSPGALILLILVGAGLIAGFVLSVFAGFSPLGSRYAGRRPRSGHFGFPFGFPGGGGGFSSGGGGFSGGGGGFGGGGASGSW
jgi:uncharacterized protein